MTQSHLEEQELEGYPIPCETCGEPILSEEEDFNGMCEECFGTPLDEEEF